MAAFEYDTFYPFDDTDSITVDFTGVLTNSVPTGATWWISNLGEIREAFWLGTYINITNDYYGYNTVGMTDLKAQLFDFRLNAPYNGSYISSKTASLASLTSSTLYSPANGTTITFQTNQGSTIYTGTLDCPLDQSIIRDITPPIYHGISYIEFKTIVPAATAPATTTIINGARSWMDLTNSQTSLVGQFLQITANGVQAAPMVQDQVDYSALANFSGNNVGAYLQLTPSGVVAVPKPAFFTFSHNKSSGGVAVSAGDLYPLSQQETFAGYQYAGTIASGITLTNDTAVIETPGVYGVKAIFDTSDFQFVINGDSALVYNFPDDITYFNFSAGNTVSFLCLNSTVSLAATITISRVA